MSIGGVHLLGVDATTGHKLLLTVGAVVAYVILRRLLSMATRTTVPPATHTRVVFWIRQVLSVVLLVGIALTLISIWFANPSQVTTVGGLLTAGIAVALQRVITAFAAYLILMRGSTFQLGDRVVMGGVRGDVIGLDPFQTTIMEMGQAPAEQADPPAMWVHGRQFTGRIVTVNNGVIFDKPVYNLTRDFPYIWDEIMIPIAYGDKDGKAEEIMLEAARRHAVTAAQLGDDERVKLEQRYGMAIPEIEPRTFYTLTDNWIAIALRYLVLDHGARAAKDRIHREILAGLRREKIGVASGTYAIVEMPPLRIENGAAVSASAPRSG